MVNKGIDSYRLSTPTDSTLRATNRRIGDILYASLVYCSSHIKHTLVFIQSPILFVVISKGWPTFRKENASNVRYTTTHCSHNISAPLRDSSVPDLFNACLLANLFRRKILRNDKITTGYQFRTSFMQSRKGTHSYVVRPANRVPVLVRFCKRSRSFSTGLMGDLILGSGLSVSLLGLVPLCSMYCCAAMESGKAGLVPGSSPPFWRSNSATGNAGRYFPWEAAVPRGLGELTSDELALVGLGEAGSAAARARKMTCVLRDLSVVFGLARRARA